MSKKKRKKDGISLLNQDNRAAKQQQYHHYLKRNLAVISNRSGDCLEALSLVQFRRQLNCPCFRCLYLSTRSSVWYLSGLWATNITAHHMTGDMM